MVSRQKLEMRTTSLFNVLTSLPKVKIRGNMLMLPEFGIIQGKFSLDA
jgi:hypothetical protein